MGGAKKPPIFFLENERATEVNGKSPPQSEVPRKAPRVWDWPDEAYHALYET